MSDDPVAAMDVLHKDIAAIRNAIKRLHDRPMEPEHIEFVVDLLRERASELSNLIEVFEARAFLRDAT